MTVLSAILGTTQDVTTPGTGHTQRFALGDDDHHHHDHHHDDHEHQRFLMEKLIIVTTLMVTKMDSSLCMENVRCIDAQ